MAHHSQSTLDSRRPGAGHNHQSAKNMAPKASTRKKRAAITVDYLEKVHQQLSDTDPLDVAAFACLTSAFWATARLGELMVKNLSAFNPKLHVKRSDVSPETDDRNGLTMTTIHVPQTKSN